MIDFTNSTPHERVVLDAALAKYQRFCLEKKRQALKDDGLAYMWHNSAKLAFQLRMQLTRKGA